MSKRWAEDPRLRARIAGGLYLVVVVTIFADQLISLALIAPGDASATWRNIAASEPLFRLGVAAHLVSLATYVVVTAIFYDLLKIVSRGLALLAVLFSLICGAFSFANELVHLAPLGLLHSHGPALETQQLQQLALSYLELSAQGNSIAQIPFGLHCVVIGWLVFRSTFFPPALGALVAAAGVADIAHSFLALISPDDLARLPAYLRQPGFGVGDPIVCLWLLWLLIVGLNASQWESVRAGAA